MNPNIASKWKQIGKELGIPKERLNTLSSLQLSPQDAFVRVINTWKELQNKPYIWDSFLKALESNEVNEVDLAKDLMCMFFYNEMSNVCFCFKTGLLAEYPEEEKETEVSLHLNFYVNNVILVYSIR